MSLPAKTTDCEPPPRGFYWHGDRLRINAIGFQPEDARFLAAEAARRDCSARDVIREIVRKEREARSHVKDEEQCPHF